MVSPELNSDRRTTALFLNPHSDQLIGYIERGLEGIDARILIPPDGEREGLLAMVPEADILIGWRSDMELLTSATRMRLFINPGTGISQHLDHFRELRKTRDVVLANGHGNSYSVAQHTVALTMALANKVIPHHRGMVDGRGSAGGPGTTYLRDITVGLLGYGAINKKVHKFLSGFDLGFAACRYSWDKDPGPFATEISKYTPDRIADFFRESDVVISALPTTAATEGCVTSAELALLGESGLFVNVGRAGAVVQEDIFRALKEGMIAGAALEVWWGGKKTGDQAETDRQDPYQFPFHELDNVVMSPHRGADSGGDLRRWDEVIENIKRMHAGRDDFVNVVDIDLEY
jgi:phosphoglycerate dehydrogenase-like enzyme